MEDWIDLTNYREHPTQKNYQVFHFTNEEQADFFEELLINANIHFERHNEMREGASVQYFGISKNDMAEVKQLNLEAIGRFRKPFIANSGFRWILILVSLLVLALAIIGAIKNS